MYAKYATLALLAALSCHGIPQDAPDAKDAHKPVEVATRAQTADRLREARKDAKPTGVRIKLERGRAMQVEGAPETTDDEPAFATPLIRLDKPAKEGEQERPPRDE